MNEKVSKIIKIIFKVIAILSIAIFAYSLTPRTFQNDTYYTIKIGEHIIQNTEKVSDLLPWNKGLDMQDPFSFHESLPYTYPHWLYDVATYAIYSMTGFQGIYYATCILAIILGISIYLINMKFTKDNIISYLITIASLYCLKNFITARAQLLTFILFIFTIFGIEQFLKTKKIRYAVLLIVIPIIIANVHSAVWPFYFVLYLPYIAEYFIYMIATIDYKMIFKKILLNFKSKFGKNKLSPIQADLEKNEIKNLQKKHEEKIEQKLGNLYKIRLEKEKNIKWLILILVICAFTGLLTPIKDTPYTYLIKTNQGNTTQNISEHLPLTLIKNNNMIATLIIIFGILTFTKTKIKLRNFFMLMGLILLSFMSQRQVSMLILIGNFIIAKMLFELVNNTNKKLFNHIYTEIASVIIITCITTLLSMKYYNEKRNDTYVDDSSYPMQASNYLVNDLIPTIGKENIKLYNEYNYGSYLLFRDIPVFIDSRADLYTPEFNGEKDENGDYIGRDIFTDFLNISSLTTDYEYKFNEYGITHVMTYSNSKLKSLIEKDSNYTLLYEDNDFVIYERESAKVNI